VKATAEGTVNGRRQQGQGLRTCIGAGRATEQQGTGQGRCFSWNSAGSEGPTPGSILCREPWQDLLPRQLPPRHQGLRTTHVGNFLQPGGRRREGTGPATAARRTEQ